MTDVADGVGVRVGVSVGGSGVSVGVSGVSVGVSVTGVLVGVLVMASGAAPRTDRNGREPTANTTKTINAMITGLVFCILSSNQR